ncbi:MAG: hypothetical protein ACRDPM_23060 [Solirubrobacteraceae bacterium]
MARSVRAAGAWAVEHLGAGPRRPLELLATSLVLVVSVLAYPASPARAQAPVGPSVFYNVTYEGTVQFNTDGQDGCDFTPGEAGDFSCFQGPFHLSLTERWKATFPAVQLAVNGASASAPTAGQQLVSSGDTTDTYCADATDGCQTGHCAFSWSAPDPGAPDLMLTAQFSASALLLKVEAPWHPDPASLTVSGGLCQSAGPYAQFPDALRAITSIPISQLDTGTITRAVNSHDPGVYQLPPDCTAQAQAENSEATSCSQTMLWNGTVTITPDCTSDAARVGGESQPPCIKQKQKQEAEKAAQEDHDCAEIENNVIHTIPLGTKSRFLFTLRQASGSMGGVFYGLEQANQAIADDPPDVHFGAVARPHGPRLRGLKALRRELPATYRLIQRYQQITGLLGALMTAQDRATGAFQALSSGNQAAGGDIATQDRAVLGYAHQTVGLLGGERRLALAAATELRGIAAGIHGPGSGRLRAGIRRFASSLVSRRAASAERLAAAALNGIGR